MTLESLMGALRALARKRRAALATTGASGLATLVVLLTAFAFVLDWWLHLPTAVRAVHLTLSLGAAVWFAVRRLVRPLAAPFTVDDAAMLVERADPSLQDRLISALQLRRAIDQGERVSSRELVEHAVGRTLADLRDRDLSGAYDARGARRPLALACGLVVALAGAAVLRPAETSLFVRRFLLLRADMWPRATNLTLTVVDGDKYARTFEDGREVYRVPERTPLQVRVDVSGRMPAGVELVSRSLEPGGKRQTFAMGRPGGKEFFQHVFPPLAQSLLLSASGGDDDDEEPVVEIRVARAPRVQKFVAELEPPAYTGQVRRTTSDANLAAPEGTKIRFRFEANMPLNGFELAFDKLGAAPPVLGPDGAYVHEFALAQSDFYTYRLQGDNGVNSVEAPRYVLTSEPDQVPRVQLDLPAQNSLTVTPNAVIPLRGTATDDYGVSEIVVRHGQGDEGLPAALPLEAGDLLQPYGGRSVAFYRDLSVADLGGPKLGERARFKLLVADNRRTDADPEPHRQFGDYEYSVQVMAPADVERELAQRQARLKDRVRDLLVLAEARLAETVDLLATSGADGAAPGAVLQSLVQIETGQNRITSELSGTARQFMRVFDGYLYNRLDPGNLTEKLLVVFTGIYRNSTESDLFKVYGEAVAQVRPQATEAELLGRLVVMLELFVRSAAEKSPEVVRRLAQAGLTPDLAARTELMRGAKTMQESLIEDLHALEDRLEAWEDYLDVIQGLRDLIDLQKGVKGKAEKLTK